MPLQNSEIDVLHQAIDDMQYRLRSMQKTLSLLEMTVKLLTRNDKGHPDASDCPEAKESPPKSRPTERANP